MNRIIASILCAVALMASSQRNLRADDFDITLEYGGGSWSLYAHVVDTGDGADGSLGISSIRAFVENIDFGIDGSAVTIAPDIGAIDPVDAGGSNERPAVVDLGGTLDILYAQDLSSGGNIVGGVGVGSGVLIAAGTYHDSPFDPAFGSNGSGLTTQGLFLASSTPGGGDAIEPDSINLHTIVVHFLFGDFDRDGDVDIIDFGHFAEVYPLVFPGTEYDRRADSEPDGDVDIIDFGLFADNFGFGSQHTASIPESTSAAIAMIAVGIGFVSKMFGRGVETSCKNRERAATRENV